MHVVPDLLRYGMKFRSLYRARKANVRLSIGRQFFAQCWDEFRYFHLDRPPYARHRVLDPGPDMALVRSAYEDAGAVFPGMGSDLIDQAWGGVIDNTPDGIPVISDVARMPGLYLCTGFSGHGFSSSLGAGRCLAQWIARGAPTCRWTRSRTRAWSTGGACNPAFCIERPARTGGLGQSSLLQGEYQYAIQPKSLPGRDGRAAGGIGRRTPGIGGAGRQAGYL